jgi:hypothetical protein
MHNSTVLRTFTKLYNYLHHLILEHFYNPLKTVKPLYNHLAFTLYPRQTLIFSLFYTVGPP